MKASCLDCSYCLNKKPDIDGRVFCVKHHVHVFPRDAKNCNHIRPRRPRRK